MKQTLIYVIRHGQSTHNRDSLLSGHANPELTGEGERQAMLARDKLSHVHFDEVYSSDLKRAARTAEIIVGKPVHKTHQLHGLRERSYGHLEGKPNEHIENLQEKHKKTTDALSEDEIWRFKFAEDIESDHELAKRFVDTLRGIAKENIGKTILVGAHGGTVRSMLVELEYARPSQLPRGSIGNAAFAKLIYKDNSLVVSEVDGIIKA